MLRESNLRLPRCSEYVAVLNWIGQVASTQELIDAMAALDIVSQPLVLSCLESLANLSLVPDVRYDPRSDIWVSGFQARVSPENNIGIRFDGLRRECQKALRRSGLIDLRQVHVPKIPSESAVVYALDLPCYFRRVQHFLVPVITKPSVTVTTLEKLAAVTPGIELADVIEALKKIRRGKGNELTVIVPSKQAIRHLIAGTTNLRLRDDRLYNENSEATLSALTVAESALINAIERKGGLASRQELVDAVKAVSRSTSLATYLLKQPLLVREAPATYGIRGRKTQTAHAGRKL
jgi:hypothetical protein